VSPDAGAHELCVAACAPAPNECPAADCVPNCEAMLADRRCGALARTLIVCEGLTTSNDYYCLEGFPALKATTCPAETQAWGHCVLGSDPPAKR
jgi:hypothetical protein